MDHTNLRRSPRRQASPWPPEKRQRREKRKGMLVEKKRSETKRFQAQGVASSRTWKPLAEYYYAEQHARSLVRPTLSASVSTDDADAQAVDFNKARPRMSTFITT